MSNSYTQTSFAIGDLTPEEVEWIEDKLIDAEEDLTDIGEHDLGENTWHISDNGGHIDVEATAQLVGGFLSEFRPKSFVVFGFANTCDRHLPDGFDGGAVLVTALGVTYFDPMRMAKEEALRLSLRPANRSDDG